MVITKTQPRYEVIVGNIGSVYAGNNSEQAGEMFRTYCRLSEQQYGRAAGEPVTLLGPQGIEAEYHGTQQDH